MSSVVRNTFTLVVVALTALSISLAAPRAAQAQTTHLSIQVILASNGGGGMDGALSGISSQLRSRFGQYSDFRLMGNHTMSINQGSAQSLGLPNGETMTISFLGMSGSSYRIQVSLPGGGTTVTAPAGGIFFVAGPRYQSGIIIVAITP